MSCIKKNSDYVLLINFEKGQLKMKKNPTSFLAITFNKKITRKGHHLLGESRKWVPNENTRKH